MAELVLERRAGLRSNGARIREVVRLKELQHHFISYRSKVGLSHFLEKRSLLVTSLFGFACDSECQNSTEMSTNSETALLSKKEFQLNV